nr:ribonuclease H-like domain-containing protein [Tanacetum cinerariifolium]
MKYQLVTTSNPSKPGAGFQEQFDAAKAEEENVQQYVLFPLWSFGSKNLQNTNDDAAFEVKEPESEVQVSPSSSAKTKKNDDKNKRETKGKSPFLLLGKFQLHTNTFSAVGPSNTAVSPTHGKSSYVDTSQYPDDPNIPALEDITYSDDEEDVGAEADFSNMETTITFSLIPTTRVQKDHPVTQIIGDLSLATQKRSMTKVVKDQSGLTQINNEDFQTCMFACFLSQEEPRRVHQALKDLSWIEVMKDELLQFKMQKVWVLVDFLNGKRAIGFEDPEYPDKVYKVVKALYGLHQAPRAWYETLANYLLENGFQRRKIDQTLFIKKQKVDILLLQVTHILKYNVYKKLPLREEKCLIECELGRRLLVPHP